jgi:hypothetical protein
MTPLDLDDDGSIQSLLNEYWRYRTSLSISRYILSVDKVKYKLTKTILERWCLNNANNNQGADPWVSTEETDQSALLEMSDRGISNAREILSTIKDIIAASHTDDELRKRDRTHLDLQVQNGTSHSPKPTIDFHLYEIRKGSNPRDNRKIKVYTFTLTAERVSVLIDKAKQFSNANPYILIMTVALRYESIWANHRQWAVSRELIRSVGYPVEGMSSPFNSQCLLLWSGAQFCSLFPDIEWVFGSLGSFFNITSFEGCRIFVHPPRIFELYDRVVDFCISQCKKSQCSFALLLCAHDNNTFVEKMRCSGYLKSEGLVDMDIYPSENPNNGTESTTSRGDESLYILSSETISS